MRIEIPTPCHQDWNRMEVREKGRFCESCQKEVVDYTQYSRGELFQGLKGKKNLCGRFYAFQLERNFTSGNKTNLHFSRWAMFLGLGSVLGFSQPTVTNNPKPKIELRENLGWKSILPKTIVIKGKVVTPEGLPLGGVNIVYKGSTIGTQTDFDGNFSLSIPTNKLDEENYLLFTYVGYETKEFRFYKKNENLTFTLVQNADLTQVVIVAGGISVEYRQNIFDKIGRFFGNLFSK